jgi:hypothetical protein
MPASAAFQYALPLNAAGYGQLARIAQARAGKAIIPLESLGRAALKRSRIAFRMSSLRIAR